MTAVNGTALEPDAEEALEPDVEKQARQMWLDSQAAGEPLSDRKLAQAFGFSRTWGTYRIREAKGQRDPGAAQGRLARKPMPEPARDPEPASRPRQAPAKPAAVPVAQDRSRPWWDAVRRFVTAKLFWPRAAILVGVGWTITMNVTAGVAWGFGSALLAAMIPVGFVIALETFIKMLRAGNWSGLAGKLRAAGVSAPLLIAAGITGVVSWLHGHQVCLWTHNADPEAMLIPFLPDLMIVCGTVALVVITRKRTAG